MAGTSSIEWTERVWNPVAGCKIVSPGCSNCYAMRMANRLGHNPKTPIYHGLTHVVNGNAVWTGEFRLVESALLAPLSVKKPTVWFVNSMSDLFGEGVLDEWIDKVFAVMALTPHHTYQVLTKRPARARTYLTNWPDGAARFHHVAYEAHKIRPGMKQGLPDGFTWELQARWPLPNVWLGVSTEDQRRFDERWPELEATPAAVRFVSYEPALGGVRLGEAKPDWLIFGDESGPGRRPAQQSWARDVRDDCANAGTAFFYKQAIIDGRKVSLPELDSVVHDARPEIA